jgi:hypothetical protein
MSGSDDRDAGPIATDTRRGIRLVPARCAVHVARLVPSLGHGSAGYRVEVAGRIEVAGERMVDGQPERRMRARSWIGRGLALGAGCLGALALTRTARRIGAAPGEVAASLPGDELIAAGTVIGPVHTSTHATTVAASPAAVWPWLVQMGHRRGGWYAADRLEALMGAGDFATGRSADRVVPELQALAAGDAMPLSDRMDLTVARLEAPHTLVLTLDDGPLVWVWSFHVHGGTPGAGSSRLVVRTRIGARRAWIRPLLVPLDLGHAAMQTLQLARLRRRIEQPRRR